MEKLNRCKRVVDWGGVFFMMFISFIMFGVIIACFTGALISALWSLPLFFIGIGLLGIWVLIFILFIEEGVYTYDFEEE